MKGPFEDCTNFMVRDSGLVYDGRLARKEAFTIHYTHAAWLEHVEGPHRVNIVQ